MYKTWTMKVSFIKTLQVASEEHKKNKFPKQ